MQYKICNQLGRILDINSAKMNLVNCNFYLAHEMILSDPIKYFNNFLVSSYSYKLSICFKSRYSHFYVLHKVIMLLNQGLLHAMHKKSQT